MSCSLDVELSMRLCEVEAALREFVADLETEALSAEVAADLLAEFATIEELAAAGKARAAGG